MSCVSRRTRSASECIRLPQRSLCPTSNMQAGPRRTSLIVASSAAATNTFIRHAFSCRLLVVKMQKMNLRRKRSYNRSRPDQMRSVAWSRRSVRDALDALTEYVLLRNALVHRSGSSTHELLSRFGSVLYPAEGVDSIQFPIDAARCDGVAVLICDRNATFLQTREGVFHSSQPAPSRH